jgi:predicted metal-dependent RNase
MNWDYIAGFFDGEGTIYVSITTKVTGGYGLHIRPICKFSQKDKRILEEIRDFIGFGVIRFSQRAYGLDVECLDAVKMLCRELGDRTYVKHKQFVLLQQYLEIKEPYIRKSVPKNVMVQLLKFAGNISLNSIKPSVKFQVKIKTLIEQIEKSDWSPEVRYRQMSKTRRANQLKLEGGQQSKQSILAQFDFAPNQESSYQG